MANQSGAVTLLDPYLPIRTLFSKRLEAHSDTIQIAGFLAKIRKFCMEQIEVVSKGSMFDKDPTIALNFSKYHTKPIDELYISWEYNLNSKVLMRQ